MPSLRVARFVSILGHPVLVMPLAALLASRAAGNRASIGILTVLGILLFGGVVLGYAAMQVRRGRWQHVDASGHDERRSLNAFLLGLFSTAASLAWFWAGTSPLFLTMALSATIILFALLISPWCKLSLHVAFVVFAAFIPGTVAAGLCIGTLGAWVAWSRLKLGRHTPLDLVAGLLAGAVAGIVLLAN